MASTADLYILLKLKDEASKELNKIAGPGGLGGLEKAAIAAGAALAGALAAGLASSIGKAAEFEKAMSGIKAVSGATASEMEQLADVALQLGKDTSFSAKEAADGIEELVKGGVSVADIMGGAAKTALDLAASSGESVGESAKLAAQAMALFNIEGKDTAQVADLIAGFANATTGSMGDFKTALSAGGAAAKLAGQDFDQFATAIALMGKAGILGSDAGTSLKTMLLNLIPTTERQSEAMRNLGLMTNAVHNNFLNADGSFKDLRDISGELNRATKDLTESERALALEAIFGSDAIRAAAILAEAGAEGFDNMAEAIGGIDAGEVAKTRLDNLAGSMEALGGSVDTAQITLGREFLPIIRSVVDGLTKFVNDAVIPFIETHAPSWVKAIASIGEAWDTFLANTEDLREKIDIALKIIPIAIKQFQEGDLGKALESLKQAFLLVFDGLGDLVGPKLEELGQALITWIQEQTPKIAAELKEWEKAFGAWIGPATEQMNTDLRKMGDQLDASLQEMARNITTKILTEWVPAFVEWIIKSVIPGLNDEGTGLPQIALTIINFIVTLPQRIASEAEKIGIAIVTGILQGIANSAGQLKDRMVGLAGEALQAARDALGAHSPSEEFAELGEEIPHGLAVGVEREAHVFYQAMADIAAGGSAAFLREVEQAPLVLTFEGLLEAMTATAEARNYRERLGKAGADLMNALDAAITEATPKNIQTVATIADKMLVEIERQFGKGDALGDQLMAAVRESIIDSSPENIRALESIIEQLRIRGEFAAEQAGKAIGDRLIAGTTQTYNGMMAELAQGWRDAGWPYQSGGGGMVGGGLTGGSGISIGGQAFTGGTRSGGSPNVPGLKMSSGGMRPPNVPGNFVFNPKALGGAGAWEHPNFQQLVVNVNSPIGINDLHKMVDQGIRAGNITSVPRGL